MIRRPGVPGRAAAFFWILVLVGAGLAVAVGASPSRAAAQPEPAAICFPVPCTTVPSTIAATTTVAPPPPTDSTTTSSTTTVATPPTTLANPAYTVAFVPCGTTTGPCDQEPGQVQVRYGTVAPAAVELQWVSRGRAAAAPAPSTASVTLLGADGSACGPSALCWQWPAQMTDASYILNGSYQVVACDTYAQAQCQASTAAMPVGLAVPPGEPRGVQVARSGTAVVVSWHPPAAAPPDLVGYTIRRDGRAIWMCSTDGLGPGRPVRCPPSMAVADQPGDGTFTYAVSAMRLGVDSSDQNVVSSAGAGGADGGKVTVTGATAGIAGGGGGAGSSPGFTPSPVIGSAGTTVGLSPVGIAAPVAVGSGAGPALGAAGNPQNPQNPQNLQYPSTDDPVVGHSALALQVHPSAARTDVAPVAVLALGLLVLAVAAHFLYLRVAVGVVEARLAGARRRP